LYYCNEALPKLFIPVYVLESQQNTTKAMKTVLSNCELIEDTQYLNKQPQGGWDGINNC